VTSDKLLDAARLLSERLTPGDLDATLSRITAAAVEVLPRVELSSITVRHSDGRLVTVAPSDDLLLGLDARQYELREGPCYAAATDERQMVSSDLGSDPRFPTYGAEAEALGIRAQMGVRLFDTPTSQGALNLYSGEVGAFDDDGSVSALFTHQAGQAIAYAAEIGNLAQAVRTRTVIGQAIGILMERYSLNDQRAFAFLQRLSSHRNVKLRQVAQELVDDAGQAML
jgi:GAF domain-containing protein